jgi:hypothetical protein
MNIPVLIDSLVRQVTVLIAQLATAGGVRAPVAHLANQVFVQLARELESQGVSRKVSADMFGMALRAYVRKLRRLSEAQSQPGVTLWQAVLEFIRTEKLVARTRVLARFAHDDELSLTGVLHDLMQSGLVFSSGLGEHAVFRAASDEELGELSRISSEQGLDELVWVLVYREGPLDEPALAARLSRSMAELALPLERLTADGRVQRSKDGRLSAVDFLLPLNASAGWEAAVFDHVQAVVQTICQRLQQAAQTASTGIPKRPVGASTYSFDVWPGHPLYDEVSSNLSTLRQRLGDLRLRVDAHNRQRGLPTDYEQIITYVGQCCLARELEPDLVGEDAGAQTKIDMTPAPGAQRTGSDYGK